MPAPDEILRALPAIANEWRLLAVVWHVAIGALVAAVMIGAGPSVRLVGTMLAAALASVSALAAAAGNPFNTIVIGGLALALLIAAWRAPRHQVRVSPYTLERVTGTVLLAFGWAYPHFLDASGWWEFLYAAPMGLLPCPTLAALIGVTLLVTGPRSRTWTIPLAAAAVLYGLVGVVVLGVWIDVVLLAGGVWLAALSVELDRRGTLVACHSR
jgi:hypothetical protein